MLRKSKKMTTKMLEKEKAEFVKMNSHYRYTELFRAQRRFNSMFDNKNTLKNNVGYFEKAKEAMKELESMFEVKQKRVEKCIENMD